MGDAFSLYSYVRKSYNIRDYKKGFFMKNNSGVSTWIISRMVAIAAVVVGAVTVGTVIVGAGAALWAATAAASSRRVLDWARA